MQALSGGQFETNRVIGHGIRGAGGTYELAELSEWGAALNRLPSREMSRRLNPFETPEGFSRSGSVGVCVGAEWTEALMRVLIVEDQDEIRELFGQVIRASGHDVEVYADGESASEAYTRGRFSLILLDWELRGVEWTGFNSAKKSGRIGGGTGASS